MNDNPLDCRCNAQKSEEISNTGIIRQFNSDFLIPPKALLLTSMSQGSVQFDSKFHVLPLKRRSASGISEDCELLYHADAGFYKNPANTALRGNVKTLDSNHENSYIF